VARFSRCTFGTWSFGRPLDILAEVEDSMSSSPRLFNIGGRSGSMQSSGAFSGEDLTTQQNLEVYFMQREQCREMAKAVMLIPVASVRKAVYREVRPFGRLRCR
jgi:hypothetical protein